MDSTKGLEHSLDITVRNLKWKITHIHRTKDNIRNGNRNRCITIRDRRPLKELVSVLRRLKGNTYSAILQELHSINFILDQDTQQLWYNLTGTGGPVDLGRKMEDNASRELHRNVQEPEQELETNCQALTSFIGRDTYLGDKLMNASGKYAFSASPGPQNATCLRIPCGNGGHVLLVVSCCPLGAT